jgi:hypothetical protein
LCQVDESRPTACLAILPILLLLDIAALLLLLLLLPLLGWLGWCRLVSILHVSIFYDQGHDNNSNNQTSEPKM